MNLQRILVAEDNELDVFLIEEALRKHGVKYTLEVFSDGPAALDYLEDLGKNRAIAPPDLMLLDLNLPSVDGSEILHTIRRHPVCSSLPVIVVSSSDAPRDKAAVAALGISHYFRKPQDIDDFMELGQIVRKLVESSLTS